MDWFDWLPDINWSIVFDAMVQAAAIAVRAACEAMFSAMTTSLLITPDVTALPQVQALTDRSTWIVDTVFVLAFLAAGILVMVAGGDERARYTVKDLLPRLVVGFIAAHFSPLLCGQAIAVANALTEALAAPAHNKDGALAALRIHVDAATDLTGAPSALLLTAILLLITVLLAAILFGFLTRCATLLVLTAAAPLALACHALPHTDPLARMWWRGYAACLAVPMLQAMLLQAGQWMLLEPEYLLSPSGDGGGTREMINLFVVMVLLWYTARVPAFVARLATQSGGGGNFFGAIVRVVTVQQITRAVPGLARGVRAVLP